MRPCALADRAQGLQVGRGVLAGQIDLEAGHEVIQENELFPPGVFQIGRDADAFERLPGAPRGGEDRPGGEVPARAGAAGRRVEIRERPLQRGLGRVGGPKPCGGGGPRSGGSGHRSFPTAGDSRGEGENAGRRKRDPRERVQRRNYEIAPRRPAW